MIKNIGKINIKKTLNKSGNRNGKHNLNDYREKQPTEIVLPQMPDGGRIGIIAPASPFDPDLFQVGLKVISELGWTPVVPRAIWDKKGYLAGEDAHRAAQIHRMFADPSIDAVICARGGFGAMRLLPMLDFDLIAKNPKPFVGFSDITVLLNAFSDCCRMGTFHGPVVTSLAQNDPTTIEALRRALAGISGYRVPFSNETVISHGTVTAPIKGGNLTMLSNLAGTPYCPDFRDTLVFLEDCNEKPYRIDRKLTHLMLSGCFDHIAGILLGDFTGCGSFGEIQDLIIDLFGKWSIPIVGGIEAGHGPVNRTLPLGVPVTLDSNVGFIRFDQVTT